eukprot:ANDGO_03332.mRNA.1 hypothetical protein
MASAIFIQHALTPRVVALQRKGETSFELARAMTLQFYEKQFSISSRNITKNVLMEHGEHVIYHRYLAQFVRINDCVLVCVLPHDGVREYGWTMLECMTKFIVSVSSVRLADIMFENAGLKKQIELLLAFEELLWKGPDGVATAVNLCTMKQKDVQSRRPSNPSSVLSNGVTKWQPDRPFFVYNITVEQLSKLKVKSLFDQADSSSEPDPDDLGKNNSAFSVAGHEIVTVPKPPKERKREKKPEDLDFGKQVTVKNLDVGAHGRTSSVSSNGSGSGFGFGTGSGSTVSQPSSGMQSAQSTQPAPAAASDDLFSFFAGGSSATAAAQPQKPIPVAAPSNAPSHSAASSFDDFFGQMGMMTTPTTTNSNSTSSGAGASPVDDLFLFGDAPVASASSNLGVSSILPVFSYPKGTIPFFVDIEETVQVGFTEARMTALTGEGAVYLRLNQTVDMSSWPETLPSFGIKLSFPADKVDGIQANPELGAQLSVSDGSASFVLSKFSKSQLKSSQQPRIPLCTYKSAAGFREQPFKFRKELRRTDVTAQDGTITGKSKSGVFMFEYIFNPQFVKESARTSEVTFALYVEGGPVSQGVGKPAPCNWNPQAKRFIWKITGPEAQRAQLFAKLSVEEQDVNSEPVRCVGISGKFEILNSSWSGLGADVQDMGLQLPAPATKVLRSGERVQARFTDHS